MRHPTSNRPVGRLRGVAVIAAIAAIGVMPASTTAQDGDSVVAGKRLTFITWGNASEYQIAQGEWFKQFAEAEGASVNVIDGKIDPLAQIKAIEDSVAAGVDGIVIQQIDPVPVVAAVNAAKEAGVPIMNVGGLADPSAMIPVGGTFNDEQLVRESARDAAQWLRDTGREKAEIVLFDVPQNIVCHDWRMAAFKDELIKELGADNVVDVYNDLVDQSLDVVTTKMEDIIQSGRSFNIYSACGGTGAVGGLDALTSAGRAKMENGIPADTWVLSIDATPGELAYLLDPEVSLMNTIALTPKTNAEVFLANFKQILSGEIAPDANHVAEAPGVLFRKADGCEIVSTALADQYAIVPGYQAVDCSTIGS
ncbi:MAG: sugar ABC transporter substrate-binding protein [Chloroflexi bacterium]|nr:sugar ABC transporter substrate-binding protein [Chloroflexota bacterium]